MKSFGSIRKDYLDEAYLEEKNKPTSPEKWARAKAAAKSKFAVYPSAYANAWAAKKYKSMGGGWRSTNEEVEQVEESHVAIAMGKEMDDEGSMVMNQLDQIQRACEMLRKEIKDPEMQLPAWVQSKVTLAADYMETVAGYMASKNEKVNEEIEQIEEGETIVTPKKTAFGEPPKGTYAYERKYGAYTAKGELRKKPNPNKPPVKEDIEQIEEGDYSVTVKHTKDGQTVDHEYVVKNAYSTKHARSIAMQRHEKKVGGLKSGEQFSASTNTIKELNKEEVEHIEEATPAWQRKEGKSEAGGLNRKGIASYRRENPGSKLSMAVTTKPSKLKPGSKAANRRKSFCARMGGMKKRLTSAKTARDPDSRINKALRKWNC
jgi:hypothetical protein